MQSQLEAITEDEREELVKDLNDLLQLDLDAIEAYEETLDRLENPEWADQVAAFKGDHERHVRNLTTMVKRVGGKPKERPHVTGPLKKALVAVGAQAGDNGVMRAFRANENQVVTKYDAYAANQKYPGEVAELIRRNAQDERRHYEWVVDILGATAE